MEFELVEDLADAQRQNDDGALIWDWPASSEPPAISAQEGGPEDQAICIPEQEHG